jgi:hypothetical protein
VTSIRTEISSNMFIISLKYCLNVSNLPVIFICLLKGCIEEVK